MSRIAVEEAGNGGGDGGNSVFSSPEETMMGRMGILVVCRFERLLVEEQVRAANTTVCTIIYIPHRLFIFCGYWFQPKLNQNSFFP